VSATPSALGLLGRMQSRRANGQITSGNGVGGTAVGSNKNATVRLWVCEIFSRSYSAVNEVAFVSNLIQPHESCNRHPQCDEGGDGLPVGYTASFSSLAARNATFLLALILIASPVAGLRPIRAGRFLT
jgi:hypothetical protein